MGRVTGPMCHLMLMLVLLVWDLSPGADGYRLYYGRASGQYETMLDTGPATSVVVNGSLVLGATYYFAATAYNGSGESGYSNEVAYVVPGLPEDVIPPLVRLISPLDGGTVLRKSTVAVQVEAEDAGGIAQVTMTVNDTLLCPPLTAPPYICLWQVPAAGGHKQYRLAAMAWDRSNNQGVSPVVMVVAE